MFLSRSIFLSESFQFFGGEIFYIFQKACFRNGYAVMFSCVCYKKTWAKSQDLKIELNEPHHKKTCLGAYENSINWNQTAKPPHLIRVFAMRYSTVPKDSGAHFEPSHQNLHCLHWHLFWSAGLKALKRLSQQLLQQTTFWFFWCFSEEIKLVLSCESAGDSLEKWSRIFSEKNNNSSKIQNVVCYKIIKTLSRLVVRMFL